MNQHNNYPYFLEEYKGQRTRYTCPQCRKPHEFTRYINAKTNTHYADHVGKCNREKKCGYHCKPDTRPAADNWKQSDLYLTAYEPPAPLPIDYIPADTMQATLRSYELNNFTRFLGRLFDTDTVQRITERYRIGTSKRIRNANGLACIFWQIDSAGNVRQGKVMGYDPHTGKRLKSADGCEVWDQYGKRYKPAQEQKDIDTRFIGKVILGKDSNPVQCLFGEHLLSENPDAVVCICESEKTACIMSEIFTDAVWLATGGANGGGWDKPERFAPLAGRNVLLWPDLGKYTDWSERAKILNLVCDSVDVSDLLERHSADFDNGDDIADYYVRELLHGGQTEQIHEPASEQGEAITDSDLPPGFQIIEFEGGKTLEIDGLPSQWLNDDEHAAAMRRLGASGQLKVMALLHPAGWPID